MVKRVEVLGVGIVEFPDSMDEAGISAVLSKEFGPKPSARQQLQAQTNDYEDQVGMTPNYGEAGKNAAAVRAAEIKAARAAQPGLSDIEYAEYQAGQPRDVIRDSAIALGAGVQKLAGLPVGLVAPESDLAARLGQEQAALQAEKSLPLQGMKTLASERVKEASKDGLLSEFAAAGKEYLLNPSLAADLAIETLPSMAPALAGGAAAGLGASAAGMGARGVAVAKLGGAAAANAVMNGGGARQQAFDDLKATYIKSGATEQEAEARALAESRGVAAVGAITGAAGGAFGAESAFLIGAIQQAIGRGGVRAAIQAAIATLSKELGTELAEEVAPQMVTNAIASQTDGRSVFQGIPETVAQTIAGALGMGSAGAVASGTRAYDPLAAELRGVVDQVEATQFTPDGIQSDAAFAMQTGQAPTLSDLAARQPQTPEDVLLEIINEEQSDVAGVDAGSDQGAGAVAGGSEGDPLAVSGSNDGGSASPAASARSGQPDIPVGADALVDADVTQDILALEQRQGMAPEAALSRIITEPATMPTAQQQETINAEQQSATAPAGNAGGVALGPDHAAVLSRTVGRGARVVTPGQSALPDAVRSGERQAGLRGQAGVDLGRLVGAVSGRKVIFFEGGSKPADGFAIDNDKQFLYLNVDQSVTPVSTAIHEVTHTMRRDVPEAYEGFTGAVRDVVDTGDEALLRFASIYAPKQFVPKLIEQRRAEGETDAEILDDLLATSDIQGRDGLLEEFHSDLMGRAAEHKDTWQMVTEEMARQSPNVLRAFLRHIEAMANRIKAAFSGKQGFQHMDKFVLGKDIQELEKNLQVIRRAAAQALGRYAGRSLEQREALFAQRNPGAVRLSEKRPGSDVGHKRTKGGDYVGAPAGMTPAKLGALRKRLRALAKEGEPGRFWYEDSSELILAAAEGDKELAEKIAGLLAIYSPQATVSANTSMGMKALYQWMAGEPIRARFDKQDKKAQAWMDGTIGEDQAMQIKTGNFFVNLMRKIDEDRYGFEQQGATIDMWMARVFGYGSKAIGSSARYLFAERETKRLAEELGWEPQQVQAALWVAIKSRIEAVAADVREIGKKKGWLERKVTKSGGRENVSWPPKAEFREDYETLILKTALAQEPDPSGLLKASYHFGTALRERVGQISWEAMPGKTTGVLPGIFNAPLEQQLEYLVAMDKALRDENGQDLIAKRLGLPVIATAMGPSAWQMNVGAGAQTEVVIATDRDQGNKAISVTPQAKSLLNAYAAIRGYVLAQEAVVWHFPIFDAAKKNANGVQLDFGRDPTHDEVVSLYNTIHAVSGRDDWAPAYIPGVGVRVLNFSDVPNVEFHKVIREAANMLAADVAFGTFKSDGDYVGNDWAAAPKGEQYKEIINAGNQRVSRGSGRPDLQGWVESELRPRAERVNQEFAEKYGWGNPRFSPSRSDAASDGRAGGGDAETGSRVDLPEYGTAAPGAVSAIGRHYSAQQRSNLDGRYYGAGASGREAARVRSAADQRISERIYFYVNSGKGVTPEQGVGSHAHDIRLNNLYDANADTWVQARVDRKITDANDWLSAFESAVIDNGFDGYISDFGTQRAAVLLGRHNVKPAYTGVNPTTAPGNAEPQATQPKPQTNTDADKVEAARVLPAGQMTGAEWKRLIPAVVPGADASMLDDAKTYYKSDVVSAMRGGARMSPARQIDTPEFKAWFGDSKVVDENGQPLVVYHGTVARSGPRTPDMGDIKAFDRLYTTRFRGASIDTLGSWFSTNPGQGGAEMYSGRGEGSAVYPVYLSIKNPQVTTFQLIQRRARLLANGKDDGRRIGEAEVDAYRKWLKEMGKDGIKIEASGNEGSTEFDNQVAWIALEPEQIKSATGNVGTFDPTNPDIRFSPSRVFFSQLARAFEQAPDRIFGPASQVKAWLASNAAKLQVKKDEIEWTGLNDWLDLQGKQKVTKQQVLDYLQQHGVQVEEVMKGEDSLVKKDGESLRDFAMRNGMQESDAEQVSTLASSGNETAERIVSAYRYPMRHMEGTAGTKYSQYVLPGGENYRELLLTLPSAADEGSDAIKRLRSATNEAEYNAARDEIDRARSAQYKSSHWTEPNILAHVRFNDRTDADGNKVLFIEELQSDWGQDGKKKGFDAKPPASKKPSQEERDALLRDMWQKAKAEIIKRTDGGIDEAMAAEIVSKQPKSQVAEWAGLSAEWQDLIDREWEWDQFARNPGVPSAPFVTKTEGWLDLGLKRMIAYAVEHGYDKIAFVNGEQSADRYDLSKQVDQISIGSYSGGFQVVARKDGEVVLDRVAADEKELESLVGKDIAKKHIETKQMTFKGLDLKVGGSGMKAFYDQMVPQRVSAVLKKLGGGKVETVKVPTGDPRDALGWTYRTVGREPSWAEIETVLATTRKGGPNIYTNPLNGERMDFIINRVTPDGNLRRVKKAMEEGVPFAKAFAEHGDGELAKLFGVTLEKVPSETNMTEQLGFTITPEMKGKVAQGQPLFSPQRNIGGQPLVQTWQAPDVTGFDNIVRRLQDKMVDTKRVVEMIKEQKINLGTKFDPYSQELLFHGRAAKRVADFTDFELRPLLNEMRLAGVPMEQLELYLWAKHAKERNDQIATINPGMPDGGSGLTNAEAAQLLRGQAVTKNGETLQLDPAKIPSMPALAARVRRISDRTLDTLVAYGLETQDTINTWRRTYPNYVPLMRDLEADDNFLGAFNLGMGTGQGFSVRGPASKRALGSERRVVDVLANLAMQRERAITRGEKNRVAMAVYGAALKAPNPDFWLAINPDAPKQKLQEVVAELVRLGVNPLDAQAIALEPKQRYLDPDTGLVAERINPALRGREDVLAVRVNGVDRFVMFSSNERAQQMVRNLKNLDNEQLGVLWQSVAGVTRWFAAVNTQYNPVFGLVNGVRDFQTAMLNLSSTPLAGKRKQIAAYGAQALMSIYRDLRAHRQGRVPSSAWAAEFEEFAKAGGMTGYRDMFQNSQQRAEALATALKELSLGKVKRWMVISEANPIFAWLSDYNTSIENAFRVAAYKAAKEIGKTPDEAAIIAKNLTVNFNKKGLAATQAGALYAFFNAAVQGTTRIGNTMLEHQGPGSDWKNLRLTKAGKTILYGGLVLGVMQGVIASLSGWDDEEPPQFSREKNFMLPIPGTDKIMTIPYPLGYHVIPGLGRVGTEFVLSGFRDPGKHLTRLLGMLSDAFNPVGSSNSLMQTISPTVTDPIAALAANEDWTGRQIYKEDFNRLHPTPGWTRAKDTATPWAKGLSYGINWITGAFGPYEKGLLSPTPDQIDYVIGQVTGGVGREVSKASQFLETRVTGEELPMHKVPVVGRFLGETDGVSSQVSKMYRNFERIGSHHDPLKRMREDGQDVTAYLAENPEATLVKEADRINRRVSELNKRRRAAVEAGDKAAVKQIEDQIKTTAALFNERVRSRVPE